MFTAPSIRAAASGSSSRRTSRTVTSRWPRGRTRSRSANVTRPEAGQRAVGPVLRISPFGRAPPAGRCRSRPGRCAGGDLVGGRVPEQGQRGPPGDQPAEVGDEAALSPKFRVPGRWPAANARCRRSTTHSPARSDGAARRGRPRGGDRSSAAGPAVGRAHVRVVRGIGAQPGEQLLDVLLLVMGERRVGAPLRPIVDAVAAGGVAEQKLPKPWVGYTAASSGSSPASRRTEWYCAWVSLGFSGLTRSGGRRAEQHRPAGEHRRAPSRRRST